MIFSYYIRTKYLDASIDRAKIVTVDWTPTMFYYGMLKTREWLTDWEELGLVEADDEQEEIVADGERLYRAEMRHAF